MNLAANKKAGVKVKILFDNKSRAYFVGENVTGTVLIDLPKSMPTRGVYVVFKGISQLRLSKLQQAPNPYAQMHYHKDQIVGNCLPQNHQTKSFPSTDIYFDVRQNVFGGDDETETILKAGHHSYKFAFRLPSKLPTSYEAQFGLIRYTCAALILGTKERKGIIRQVSITVISIVDLNLIRQIQAVQTKENEKFLGALFFKTGPIKTKFTLNKKGFVSGENILIDGEIINKSNREILKTVITLNSLATFQTSMEYVYNCKQIEQTLAKLRFGPIQPQATKRWSKICFKIPATAPSNLGGCRFMNLEYCVLVTITPVGPSATFSLRFPIVIGTVPLRDQFNSFRQPRTQLEESNSSNPNPGSVAVLSPEADVDLMTFPPEPLPPYSELHEMYPDLPPPTYAESIQEGATLRVNKRREEDAQDGEVDVGSEDGEETEEVLSFTPRYTYYNQFDTSEDQNRPQNELL